MDIVVESEEKRSRIAVIGGKNIPIKEKCVEYLHKGKLEELSDYDGIIEFESEKEVTLFVPAFASETQKGTIYFTPNDSVFLLNLLVKILDGKQLCLAHIYDFELLRRRKSRFIMKNFTNLDEAMNEGEKWLQAQREEQEINKATLLILIGNGDYKKYWELLQKMKDCFGWQEELLFDVVTEDEADEQIIVALWTEA